MANNIAMLIDGDNISPALVPAFLEAIGDGATPIIREVFLNKHSLAAWEEAINKYSLSTNFVSNNTKGKNAADIALVIRAMQIFYERDDLIGFCIVSSDSDFTELIRHIVAEGKLVLGIGDKRAPMSLQNACTKFVLLEEISKSTSTPLPPYPPMPPVRRFAHRSFEQLFVRGYERAAQKYKEWIPLVRIHHAMFDLDPTFENGDFKFIKNVANELSNTSRRFPIGVIQISERVEEGKTVHWVRLDSDTFKVVESYFEAPSSQKDVKGWMKLASFGSVLRKYPAYEDGVTYQGERGLKLSQIVTEMAAIYPNIEVREERNGEYIVHSIRVIN